MLASGVEFVGLRMNVTRKPVYKSKRLTVQLSDGVRRCLDKWSLWVEINTVNPSLPPSLPTLCSPSPHSALPPHLSPLQRLTDSLTERQSLLLVVILSGSHQLLSTIAGRHATYTHTHTQYDVSEPSLSKKNFKNVIVFHTSSIERTGVSVTATTQAVVFKNVKYTSPSPSSSLSPSHVPSS